MDTLLKEKIKTHWLSLVCDPSMDEETIKGNIQATFPLNWDNENKSILDNSTDYLDLQHTFDGYQYSLVLTITEYSPPENEVKYHLSVTEYFEPIFYPAYRQLGDKTKTGVLLYEVNNLVIIGDSDDLTKRDAIPKDVFEKEWEQCIPEELLEELLFEFEDYESFYFEKENPFYEGIRDRKKYEKEYHKMREEFIQNVALEHGIENCLDELRKELPFTYF